MGMGRGSTNDDGDDDDYGDDSRSKFSHDCYSAAGGRGSI